MTGKSCSLCANNFFQLRGMGYSGFKGEERKAGRQFRAPLSVRTSREQGSGRRLPWTLWIDIGGVKSLGTP